jgi:hypothetical protein
MPIAVLDERDKAELQEQIEETNKAFGDIAEKFGDTQIEEGTVCQPTEWGFGNDGNYSEYIEVMPSNTYELSFPVAVYDGYGQASLVLHKYDKDLNELEVIENDCDKTIGTETVKVFGFWRRGAEQHGVAGSLYLNLFLNGGYREFNTSEDCKYIRLEFFSYTNNPERLPDLTLTGLINKSTTRYEIKEGSIGLKQLERIIVSKNLFDKSTATTETEVYLGKNASGVEMYGWYLTGIGTVATAVSGSGLNSTSVAIKVKANTGYWKPTGTTLNIFDKDDKYVSSVAMPENSFTTPENAKYVRIGFKSGDKDALQFVEGDKQLPYEDFKYGVEKIATEKYSPLNEVLYRNALNATYLPDYMKNIAGEARKYIASNRHTFLFISDTHTTPITEYIGSLAANMTKYIPCSYIAHGGDIIDGLTDKANELEILSSLCRNFNDAQCPVLYAKGNHDYNALYAKNNGGLAADYILNDELHCHTNRFYKTHIHGKPEDMYFYIDDEETKIRTVFMDNNHHDETEVDGLRPSLNNTTGIEWGAEQMQWFADALDFSDKGADKTNWGVITVSHRMAGSCIKRIIQNFRKGISETFNVEYEIKTNFAEQGAMEFIACFVGDDHYDALEAKTDTAGSYPVIKILNASLARDNIGVPTASNGVLMPPQKLFGTENETAFDIVTIDRENKLIYLTRYGARSYCYNADTAVFDKIVSRTRVVNYVSASYEVLTD